MLYYAQFLEKNLKNDLVEALGSDGVFILDGRNTLKTMICDTMIRMHRLSNVKPGYVGYRIYKGERFSDNNQLVQQWVCSGTEYNNYNEIQRMYEKVQINH